MMRQVNEKIDAGKGGNAFPFTAGEWAKGRDAVRVAITEYNGRRCLDFRVWFTNNAGELKPSPKGLALQLDALPKLAQAVRAAVVIWSAMG